MNTQLDTKQVRVRQPVFEAMADWYRRQEAEVEEREEVEQNRPLEQILHSIPRREQIVDADERRQWLPYLEPLVFKTSVWRSLRRLMTWLTVLGTLVFGQLADRLMRRDGVERQAVRLRLALERAGGTFVKLGQQVAMRIDLVPWAVCVELSKMLDRMPPFPT